MVLVLKNLLFVVIVPGTVDGLRAAADRPGPAHRIGRSARLCRGVARGRRRVCGWCVWDFALFGRGTPAPIDAPKRLVTRGMYRLVRNPMYVGVLTIILGWAVLFKAAGLAVYAAVVGLCFHLFIVLYEEPHLRRVFGTQYDDSLALVSDAESPGVPAGRPIGLPGDTFASGMPARCIATSIREKAGALPVRREHLVRPRVYHGDRRRGSARERARERAALLRPR